MLTPSQIEWCRYHLRINGVAIFQIMEAQALLARKK